MNRLNPTSTTIRRFLVTTSVIIGIAVALVSTFMNRMQIDTGTYSGRMNSLDFGKIQWNADFQSFGMKCTILLSSDELPSTIKQVFSGDENMFRDFISFHEKAHCLAHDDILPNISESGFIRSESIADVFAADRLTAKYGSKSKDFLNKWNLLRTTHWVGGDLLHWTTPVMTPFLREGRVLDSDDVKAIEEAERFAKDILGTMEIQYPDTLRRAFIHNEDGSEEQTRKWNEAIAEKDFKAVPSLDDIRILNKLISSPDWRKSAMGWHS